MSRDINRCTEPQIYTSQATVPSFEEGRAILLGKYTERELDPQLESIIREHLSHCACCSQFLEQLEDTSELRVSESSVIYASCPSSLNLDRHVFRREEFSANEHQRIEQHLLDCAMCKEETDWLRAFGEPASMQSAAGRASAQKFGGWWASPARIQYAFITAAVFAVVLSMFFLLERASIKDTEERLRAAAVIKSPDQINYAALRDSSLQLPEKMAGVYEKGVEALKQGRFQEAIRHLELVATAHPDHSGATNLLGYSYYRMNEPERAFELCDRAEKMSPKSLERCLSLVNIALKTGHFARAIHEIDGLYHHAPDHPEVKSTYDRITAITRGRIVKL